MIGAMDNFGKLHRTCQGEEVGFVTDWEDVEEPQSRIEGEVLRGGR